ncbi:MAG: leucyl aminopeptidase [Rhodospirillaceae bacterium]|nr:leucyl aminopeptidase [Rhodospirillaceae bacterium]
MKIAFAKPELPKSGTLAVAVMDDRKLGPSAAALDRKTKGAVARAIAASRFRGRPDDLLALLAPAGLEFDRLVLFGTGKPEKLNDLGLQSLGGRLIAHLNKAGADSAAIAIDALPGLTMTPAAAAAEIAYGARLRSYRFDKYRTKEKPDAKPTLKKLSLLCEESGKARSDFEPLEQISEGVFFARDLVSEPGNVIHPESLAREARRLTELGVKVEIMGEAALKKLGMNALLGVGQGSARESQVAVMTWNGAGDMKRNRPIAFVGKGVTFDSGGISIKPAAGMEEMKWDMAGSGAVIGAMRALAARDAKANVIGIVGLVENMPSGTAQRPGDVVQSMSGQTIEIINTDAEGRLVLADILWYCQDRFKPVGMIDLATLTGAIMISLGKEHAGLFSNNDDLSAAVAAAGKSVGETVWRMPMGDVYDKQINSDIADMKNTGSRYGGSITAAQFLQRFVNDVPWVHLDIAGMAWSDKDAPTIPKGATAFGVRLLDRLVSDRYEKK